MSQWYHKSIFIALLLNQHTSFSLIEKMNPWSEKEKKETVILNKTVDKPSEISIHNIKGSITIASSTKNTIHVEATKKGPSKSLESTQITYENRDGKIAIKTVQTIREPNTKECEVIYSITIPKTSKLSTVHTVQGDIIIEN